MYECRAMGVRMVRTRVKGLLIVYGETTSQAANLNEREDERGQNPSNSVRQERVQDAL